MRIIALVILSIIALPLFGQSFSESDIKSLANQVNEKIKGVEIGKGVIAIGCRALGRNLIYHYEVPDFWEAPLNIKQELISNLKTLGIAKTYFLNDINVIFCYYKGNSLIKKVIIKSDELSTYNFKLGEYLSIKDHVKCKGVNLKIKVPVGWDVKEGDLPNVVKKFTKDDNIYLILIKDNITFFSRSESRELLRDENNVRKFVEESSSYLTDTEIIDVSVVTINTYPSITFKVKGKMERLGVTFSIISRCWTVFYEDKIVTLQSIGFNDAEFRALEQLYFLITSSVLFPDQYD